MHIGINAHLLARTGTYREAGLSKHIAALVRHLTALETPHQWTVFVGKGQRPPWLAETPHVRVRESRVPTLRPALRIAWEQTILPFDAARYRLDVLACPVNVRPFLPTPPAVVTVHDLVFLRYPDRSRRTKRLYLRALTGWSVRRARRVIAVSESTANDIVALLGLPRRRITVVPNGLDNPALRPLPPEEVAAFRRAKGLPDRVILYVGTLEPRKNLPALIRAYAAVRAATGATLVLAGGKGWFYDAIFRTVRDLGLEDAVRFPGYVPDAELPLWYNSAEVFVYPSLYEGFGLPALEALACGVPVIAANTSALPEVVGTAGLLVDPADAAAFATALRAVLRDPALAARLRAAGPPQAARFSWETSARRTLAVYESAIRKKLEIRR
jgi:glycosyltransferase involved in cell wall biosynthesis